ncbi:MAG: PKD domain-containing protein [Ilumatobacteraceae bacterium]
MALDPRVLLVALLFVVGVVAVVVDRPQGNADIAPIDPTAVGNPATVTADALPTAQIDGVAWTQAVVGNTVYVGGRFAKARPAGSPLGSNEVARPNLLAYDLTTGNLITSFAPTLNGEVRALVASADGTTLYAGGVFKEVNGQQRMRVAAFSTATGALLPFAPPISSTVTSLAFSGNRLYVGGDFASVGSVARSKIAAFDVTSGALLAWAPQVTGGSVGALAVSPAGDKVALGGNFTALNGSSNPGFGLGSVNAVTGASEQFLVNGSVRNAGERSAIISLTTNGENVLGTSYWFGGTGNFEGTFSARWSNGEVTWMQDCHGDTYSAWSDSKAVYTVGHAHSCGNIGGFPEYSPRRWYYALAFSDAATGRVAPDTVGYPSFAGNPSPSLLVWNPVFTAGRIAGQAGWHVTGNSDYVVVAGEFTAVNYVGQQGLVRFARAPLAPGKQQPLLWGAGWVPRAVSTEPGTVRITWPANHDRDNATLTYTLYRNWKKIYTTQETAPFWQLPTLGFTDRGLTPGSTQSYRVLATDSSGNEVPSAFVEVQVQATGGQPYPLAVLEAKPLAYWRLGATPGTDLAGYDDLTIVGGTAAAGAVVGDADGATAFNGATTARAIAKTRRNSLDSFSVTAWVQTTTAGGGHIIGFGNSGTALSTMADRLLFMRNDGKVAFAVRRTSQLCNPSCTTVGQVAVTSDKALNDGQWHQVTGTLGNGDMKLYVDGVLVGTVPNVVGGAQYAGFWRVGGDQLSAITSKPTNNTFTGSIDEAAVFPYAVSPETVARLFVAGSTGTTPNQAPVASFTAIPTDLTVAVDASASADPEGGALTYAWTFGPGETASGRTASYTYPAAGTYTVSLTVTDPAGSTSTTTRTVTVVAPVDLPPVASFTATPAGLVVALDASASTDPEGKALTYSWNLDDGSPAATGKTLAHTYAAAGTYTVTLTVADPAGQTNSFSRSVTVSVPPPGPVQLAGDAFERAVAGGLGSADVGGIWRTVPASPFSVANGQFRSVLGVPGARVEAFLDAVSSTDTDVRLALGTDKVAAGGSQFLTLVGRQVGNDEYMGLYRVLPGGQVQLIVSKEVAGVSTNLAWADARGLVAGAGELVQVRLQVTGTAPTTLRMKAWRSTDPEPADWMVTSTDAAAALQAPGRVGVVSYLSSAGSNAPVTVLIDDLQVWQGR